MTRALMLAASLIAATPAAALTCAPVSPALSYQRAAAAPEAYSVLWGRLEFDDALMPPPVSAGATGAPRPVPARFSGFRLGPNGFTVPADRPLTVVPTCAGPWCGWIPSGETWLLFAREDAGALVVEVGPCGGWVFMDPTTADLALVAACADGVACAAR